MKLRPWLLLVALALAAEPAPAQPTASAPRVCADCVRANMERLASPAMRGRGCGTEDEHAAARFLADQLKAYGVKGGLAGGELLQEVRFYAPAYASPPVVEVGGVRLVHGEQIIVQSPPPSAGGALKLVRSAEGASVRGDFVLLDTGLAYSPRDVATLLSQGAAAVIVQTQMTEAAWTAAAARPPAGTQIVGLETPQAGATIQARPEAFEAMKGLAGRQASLSALRRAPEMRTTYNVVGAIKGTAPDADSQAVLLSAHYDHLGVRGGVVFPGANDDASGTAAVLEFARLLAARAPPRRTVQFALFGCEEAGGHGARYFVSRPPLPLTGVVANLQFEMIGLPDPRRPGILMLTGWERSNLGPALRDQGAGIGPDLYPEQNFFRRSDNYRLALNGVVAHTVSAWPTPPTYHRETDDIAHLDLNFMVEVIQALVGPIDWLLNSDFKPDWNPGMKP